MKKPREQNWILGYRHTARRGDTEMVMEPAFWAGSGKWKDLGGSGSLRAKVTDDIYGSNMSRLTTPLTTGWSVSAFFLFVYKDVPRRAAILTDYSTLGSLIGGILDYSSSSCPPCMVCTSDCLTIHTSIILILLGTVGLIVSTISMWRCATMIVLS